MRRMIGSKFTARPPALINHTLMHKDEERPFSLPPCTDANFWFHQSTIDSFPDTMAHTGSLSGLDRRSADNTVCKSKEPLPSIDSFCRFGRYLSNDRHFSVLKNVVPSNKRLGKPVEQLASVIVEMERPATVDAEMKQPGTVDAEVKQPGTVKAEMKQPGTVDAEVEQPGTVKAEMKQPGTVDAEVEQPGNIDAEMKQPGSVPAVPEGIPPGLHQCAQQQKMPSMHEPLWSTNAETSGQISSMMNADHRPMLRENSSSSDDGGEMSLYYANSVINGSRCYPRKGVSYIQNAVASGQSSSPLTSDKDNASTMSQDSFTYVKFPNEVNGGNLDDMAVTMDAFFPTRNYMQESDIASQNRAHGEGQEQGNQNDFQSTLHLAPFQELKNSRILSYLATVGKLQTETQPQPSFEHSSVSPTCDNGLLFSNPKQPEGGLNMFQTIRPTEDDSFNAPHAELSDDSGSSKVISQSRYFSSPISNERGCSSININGWAGMHNPSPYSRLPSSTSSENTLREITSQEGTTAGLQNTGLNGLTAVNLNQLSSSVSSLLGAPGHHIEHQEESHNGPETQTLATNGLDHLQEQITSKLLIVDLVKLTTTNKIDLEILEAECIVNQLFYVTSEESNNSPRFVLDKYEEISSYITECIAVKDQVEVIAQKHKEDVKNGMMVDMSDMTINLPAFSTFFDQQSGEKPMSPSNGAYPVQQSGGHPATLSSDNPIPPNCGYLLFPESDFIVPVYLDSGSPVLSNSELQTPFKIEPEASLSIESEDCSTCGSETLSSSETEDLLRSETEALPSSAPQATESPNAVSQVPSVDVPESQIPNAVEPNFKTVGVLQFFPNEQGLPMFPILPGIDTAPPGFFPQPYFQHPYLPSSEKERAACAQTTDPHSFVQQSLDGRPRIPVIFISANPLAY